MNPRLRIALIPFGEPAGHQPEGEPTGRSPGGEVNQELLSSLEEELPGIFAAEIEVYPAMPLPSRHLAKDRGQYLADGLLDEFSSIVPAPGTLLLGITEADLFSPGMNFVFGIANRGRALISSFRLRPEFFSQAPNPKVFRKRILTEAVHELGHALGLPHCEYPGCVMYFSNWIGDTDRKGPGFCFRCSRTLERLMAVGEH